MGETTRDNSGQLFPRCAPKPSRDWVRGRPPRGETDGKRAENASSASLFTHKEIFQWHVGKHFLREESLKKTLLGLYILLCTGFVKSSAE